MSRPALAGLRVLLTRPAGEGADEWAAAFAAAGAIAHRLSDRGHRSARILAGRWTRPSPTATPTTGWSSPVRPRSASSRAACQPDDFPPICAPRSRPSAEAPAASIERQGGKVALVPADSRQEGLVQALRDLPAGTRVLLPLAAGGRTLLARKSCGRSGCTVDVVTVYRTEPKPRSSPPARVRRGRFRQPLGAEGVHRSSRNLGSCGENRRRHRPDHGQGSREHGLRAVVADTPGVDALILAISRTHAPNQGGT